MKPWVIAHRGAADIAPENTLAAFYAAVASGADAVELDVHLTCDGGLVVMHDDAVDRTTDGRGDLKDLTTAEVRALDAGSWFSPVFKGERVPLLREVLALPIQLIVEVKHGSERYPGIEALLLATLAEAGRKSDVIVISGNATAITTLKRLDPDLRTLAFSSNTLTESFDLSGLAPSDVVFAPPRPGLASIIRAAVEQGHTVLGTTLGAPVVRQEYLYAQIDAGVTGIFTNAIVRLKGLLADRDEEA